MAWWPGRGGEPHNSKTYTTSSSDLLSFARTAAKPKVALNERIDCKKDGLIHISASTTLVSGYSRTFGTFWKDLNLAASVHDPPCWQKENKSKSTNTFPRLRQGSNHERRIFIGTQSLRQQARIAEPRAVTSRLIQEPQATSKNNCDLGRYLNLASNLNRRCTSIAWVVVRRPLLFPPSIYIRVLFQKI